MIVGFDAKRAFQNFFGLDKLTSLDLGLFGWETDIFDTTRNL